jgi:hypothetical protein
MREPKLRNRNAGLAGRERRRDAVRSNCYVVVADDGVLIAAAPRTGRIRH